MISWVSVLSHEPSLSRVLILCLSYLLSSVPPPVCLPALELGQPNQVQCPPIPMSSQGSWSSTLNMLGISGFLFLYFQEWEVMPELWRVTEHNPVREGDLGHLCGMNKVCLFNRPHQPWKLYLSLEVKCSVGRRKRMVVLITSWSVAGGRNVESNYRCSCAKKKYLLGTCAS